MASILIIDDDAALLAMLTTCLEEAGHTVLRSGDLRHAEQLFAEEQPDLVILEVRTEANGGWDLLPRLTAEAPVLVLSAAAREEDVVRGFAGGAVDYIAKPYRTGELLARIQARLPVHQIAFGPTPSLPVRMEPAPIDPPAQPPIAAVHPPRRPEPPPDEAVFMSEAEEMAMLRLTPSTAAAAPKPVEEEPDNLGAALRNERQRRHLTLVQLENELKIRMSYLQAIEDEKFTLLPRGPVAEQMIQTYARFLNQDASATVAELRQTYQAEPAEQMRDLGGRRRLRAPAPWILQLIAVFLGIAVVIAAIFAFDPAFFGNLLQQLERVLPGWVDFMY